MKTAFIFTLCTTAFISAEAFANDPVNLIDQAAAIQVANELCDNVVGADAFNKVTWAAAAQTKTGIAETSIRVAALAETMKAKVKTDQNKADLCGWGRATSAALKGSGSTIQQ